MSVFQTSHCATFNCYNIRYVPTANSVVLAVNLFTETWRWERLSAFFLQNRNKTILFATAFSMLDIFRTPSSGCDEEMNNTFFCSISNFPFSPHLFHCYLVVFSLTTVREQILIDRSCCGHRHSCAKRDTSQGSWNCLAIETSVCQLVLGVLGPIFDRSITWVKSDETVYWAGWENNAILLC